MNDHALYYVYTFNDFSRADIWPKQDCTDGQTDGFTCLYSKSFFRILQTFFNLEVENINQHVDAYHVIPTQIIDLSNITQKSQYIYIFMQACAALGCKKNFDLNFNKNWFFINLLIKSESTTWEKCTTCIQQLFPRGRGRLLLSRLQVFGPGESYYWGKAAIQYHQ